MVKLLKCKMSNFLNSSAVISQIVMVEVFKDDGRISQMVLVGFLEWL